MATLIEKLQRKSKTVREGYAFVFALLFTLVIASLWTTSLPARLGGSFSESKESTTTPGITDEIMQSFSGVKSYASALLAQFGTASTSEEETSGRVPRESDTVTEADEPAFIFKTYISSSTSDMHTQKEEEKVILIATTSRTTSTTTR